MQLSQERMPFMSKNRAINNFLPTEVDTEILMPVLYCIPSGNEIELMSKSEDLIDLLRDTLLFTINCYSLCQEEESQYNRWEHNEWNQLLFNAVNNIGLRLPENQARCPILWSYLGKMDYCPSMMVQFLRSLLSVGTTPELEDRLAKLWPTIGTSIISEVDSIYSGDFAELAGLLVFSDPKGIITWHVTEWKPLRMLIPFIEKWCQEVGWHSEYFPSLVGLLKSVGFELFADCGINWLFECLSSR